MGKRKQSKHIERDDEIVKAARTARVRASKMTPEQRKASFERAMQLVYGDSSVNDSVGAGH
jgi:hypothetical protein